MRMAKERKNLLHLGLGLADYLRDMLDELEEELEKRGSERAEDIRDFLDDVIENIPVLRGGTETSPTDEQDEDRNRAGSEMLGDLDIRGRINDFLSGLGLATGDDIRQLKDRLERLGRAVKNVNGETKAAKADKE